MIAAIMMVGIVVSVLYPKQLREAEEVLAKDVALAEHEMEGWMNSHGHGVGASAGGSSAVAGSGASAVEIDATEAMRSQPSSWVESEKKLKAQLKVLVERQKEGKDLGAPILTRYLGEDFKAWVSKGEDQEAWEKARDAKYAEMKAQEDKWKAKVRKYMEENPSVV